MNHNGIQVESFDGRVTFGVTPLEGCSQSSAAPAFGLMLRQAKTDVLPEDIMTCLKI